MSKEITKGLADVLSQLNKTYGANSTAAISDMDDMEVETISSGSILIDRALGGGLAKGRLIEVYGPESSGKTTIALHAIAEVQKDGGVAAIIDAEHALDPAYAEALGVDVNALILTQPDNGEHGMEVMLALARSGEVDLIVIDSVAAMTPKAQIESPSGAASIAALARLMSAEMPKISKICNNTGCTVIFINQLREKPGVMYGSPEYRPGGKALKFYASQVIDVRVSGKEKDSVGEIIASGTKVKIVKNKVAPPFKTAMTQILYGRGIVKEMEVLRIAVDMGIISKKGGGHYTYEDTKLGQGEIKVIAMLEDNPDLVDELVDLIKM